MMEYRPSVGRKVTGFSLLFLGALGTVLPVLQGALFLALGLWVLRHQYHWAHRCMLWSRDRWPRQVEGIEAMEERLLRRVRALASRTRAVLRRP
jgi:hypothetical protein